jgi:hypothetical protein
MSLLDSHFYVDLLATSTAREARWIRRQFCVGSGKYDFVLCPHFSVIDRRLLRLLGAGNDRVAFVSTFPGTFDDGNKVPAAQHHGPTSMVDLLARIMSMSELRPVRAPAKSWVTTTQMKEGTIVSLIPSRSGYRYGGEVRLGGKSIMLPETDELTRILFPSIGEPMIL